ncbi:hypothetical protein WEN_02765 [Mycoplasma wenyonii str. Massachusetts]|uniref:dUTPase n=1 Tax=Mycoplasma wenyonii (strain Massachusetts) TaxID=1197325 RepID=I6YBG6_MYCWM|nr:dUTPase [Mycoplasma wenyonii]AFN65336.1 hypothetical protein WEN_02765 [Mycoplasma wenyonii str. Massachusetts]
MFLSELVEYQKKLDSKVFEIQKPNLDEYHLLVARKTALVSEYFEFLNETKLFKYWTNKEIELEKLYEEFIDIVHFTLSLLYVYNLEETLGTKYSLGISSADTRENLFVKARTDNRLKLELLNTNYSWMIDIYSAIEKDNFAEWLGWLSQISIWLALTSEEIKERYLSKWRVNFERLGVTV